LKEEGRSARTPTSPLSPGQKQIRRHSTEKVNVYTECGRHGDEWLFGGFSLPDKVKRLWQKDPKVVSGHENQDGRLMGRKST